MKNYRLSEPRSPTSERGVGELLVSPGSLSCRPAGPRCTTDLGLCLAILANRGVLWDPIHHDEELLPQVLQGLCRGLLL